MADQMVRLSMVPCNTSGESIEPMRSPEFKAMLNPSTIKHSRKILYEDTNLPGKSANTVKFKSMGDDTLDFSLLFDGTGVVNKQSANTSVESRIELLNKVVHHYDGEKHEPHVVRVLWGKLIFFGRLSQLEIEYTLFKPTGEPLRANTSLSFTGTMSAKEEALKAKRSSPDLTHQVLFRAGDSLPLLCYRIYGDSAYYPAVARHNNIVNFRSITPGTILLFPPLS